MGRLQRHNIFFFWYIILLFSINVHDKYILYHFKICSQKICWSYQKKVIFDSWAFKYLRYKKVILDENQKTRFSDLKKNYKKPHKHKNVLQKRFLSDLVYQLLILMVSWRCCDQSATLMFVFFKYCFRNGF